MLLYVKHFAQMCNRLWALTPALAYALHKKQKLYVLFAKKEYLDCFPHLKNNAYIKFLFSRNSPSPSPLEWRMALLSERLGVEVKGDLMHFTNVGGLSFIDGWKHSSDISFIAEHKNEIIDLFKPCANVVDKVKYYFHGYDGITVGIHVRRGDYKDYLGGRYFFSDDVYLNVINDFRKQMDAEGKRVRFLICSNDNITIKDKSNDIFSIQGSNGITDLYALSCCDFIIGPPSSYSQWASFYGNVPLRILLDTNSSVNIDDYSRIVTFNKFENGKLLNFEEVKQEYFII